MRPISPFLVLVFIGACVGADPEPPATPHVALPPLGSPRPLAAPAGQPIAPFPRADDCLAIPGSWPGELTGCYDVQRRLGGIELDVAPDELGAAIVAVRDTYAPRVSPEIVATGGIAWVSDEGVRLEVVREPTLVHVRATGVVRAPGTPAG